MRALLAVFCLSIGCTASAQQYPGNQVAGSAASDGGFPADPYYVASPDQVIRQGIDRLVGFLIGSGDPDPQAVHDFVELEIAPHFDFAYMSRWAAGPLVPPVEPPAPVSARRQAPGVVSRRSGPASGNHRSPVCPESTCFQRGLDAP